MLSFIFDHFCRHLCGCGSIRAEVAAVEHLDELTPISLLPEDVMMKQILSFLKLREVVRLDSALANRGLRKFLHVSLNGIALHDTIDFRFFKWCEARKCSTKNLRITSALRDDHFVNASGFEVLQVCTTAKISEYALSKMLAEGKDFKTLDVRFLYNIRSYDVLPRDVNLPLLEINVSGNFYVQENVMVSLVKRCPHLRVINASKCFQFTNRVPIALAKSCPHLREIYLAARGTLQGVEPPSTGYCQLFQSCRQLELVDCSGISRYPICKR